MTMLCCKRALNEDGSAVRVGDDDERRAGTTNEVDMHVIAKLRHRDSTDRAVVLR